MKTENLPKFEFEMKLTEEQIEIDKKIIFNNSRLRCFIFVRTILSFSLIIDNNKFEWIIYVFWEELVGKC